MQEIAKDRRDPRGPMPSHILQQCQENHWAIDKEAREVTKPCLPHHAFHAGLIELVKDLVISEATMMPPLASNSSQRTHMHLGNVIEDMLRGVSPSMGR